jgi:23S rRNA (pseudouridine1915-N3)-methyltransferase
MKIHIITIGQPKLEYAKLGFAEYLKRLQHYHQIKVTHIADKHNDSAHILATAGNSHKVGLVIEGKQNTSEELAEFLEASAVQGKDLSFIVGGPDGLPPEIIEKLDYRWSFGKLTLPHDLAMIVLVEALYRASTIGAGQPYHR